MKCPTDGAVLEISERSGVEIDYCPDCRGVWLDRGELDRILERSPVAAARPEPPSPPPAPPRYHDERHVPAARWTRDWDDDDDYVRGRPGHDDRRDHEDKPKKRRGSFLSELLEL